MDKTRLATIIDCEGTVQVQGFDHNRYLRGAIIITQKEKWYCERFKKEFGFGSVYFDKSNDCWKFSAYNIQALIICLVLLEKLEIKQENAKQIIVFYKQKLQSNSQIKNTLIKKMRRYNLQYNGQWVYNP